MRAIAGRLLLLAVALAVVVGPSRAPVEAESYDYTPKTRQVKACILLLDSFKVNGQPENPDPHVFYLLDSEAKGTAKGLKPRDWEIVNPLAPRIVTPDIKARWDAIDPSAASRPDFQINSPVTKEMACYWEVPLSSTPLEDLLQFDLIAVMTHAQGGFSLEDSAKLRRLVDLGVTLWFDDCAGARIDPNRPFFIRDFNFDSSVKPASTPDPTLVPADRFHPLLNSPFALTTQELEQLGDKGADHFTYRITNLAQSGPPSPLLAPIVNSNGDFGDGFTYPVIAGGRYGDGVVLVTSGDIACAINDRFNAGPNAADANSGAFCGDLPAAWDESAQNRLESNMKFAFNVLNWTAGESNYRKGPHRAAYTRDEVSPGLDTVWKVPFGESVRLLAPPVVWRDFAFFTIVENQGAVLGSRIFAVDMRPYEDRDGRDENGNPRDGLGNPNDGMEGGWVDAGGTPIVDLTPESPYDVIWRYDLPDTLASEPYVTTVVVNQRPVDVLFFTTQDGLLHALRAMPTVPNADGEPVLADATEELPGYPMTIATAPTRISAPVVSREHVYVVSTEAGHYYLNVVVASTGISKYKVPVGTAPAPDQSTLTAPAVVLMGNEETGSTTEIAYAPLPTGELAALATYTYGEWAQRLSNDPSLFQLQHAWRRDPAWSALDPVPPTTLKVTVLDTLGYPVGPTNPNLSNRWAYQVDDVGVDRVIQVRRQMDETTLVPIPEGFRVIVDYEIDPSRTGGMRTPWTFTPGYPAATPLVQSGAAVASNDSVVYASANGFVQMLAERGTANANGLLWRCNVNDYVAADTDANGFPTFRRSSFTSTDGTTYEEITWIPAWWDPDRGWIPLAPAVTDDMVYIAMNRYALKVNGMELTTDFHLGLLEGAVFAFERWDTMEVDLGDVTGADLSQLTLITHLAEVGGTGGWIASTQTHWGADPNTYWRLKTHTVDGQTYARIIFERFPNELSLMSSLWYDDADADALPNNLCSPIWVDLDGPGTAVPRPYAVNGRKLSNLAWRYPDPEWHGVPPAEGTGPRAERALWLEGVTSSPTVSGGVVYVAAGDGRLFALDADPRQGARGAEFILVDDGIADAAGAGWLRQDRVLPRSWTPRVEPGYLRVPPDLLGVWPDADPQGQPVIGRRPLIFGGATATSAMLLLGRNEVQPDGTFRGSTVYALSRPVYTVADAKRMLELDGEGRVLSGMSEARDDTAERALNHPAAGSIAGHFSSDGQATLFADTGNHRVVAVDRAGQVVWEAREVYDFMNLLPQGEYEVVSELRRPLVPFTDLNRDNQPDLFTATGTVRVSKLQTPADARSWVTYETDGDGQRIKVWHTLIADSGNYRVMEIVDKWVWNAAGQRWDRYRLTDPAHGNPYWYHVVVWASQTRARHRDASGQWQMGQNYRYTSAQVVEYAQGYARRVLCTVSNYALYRAGGRRHQRAGASLVMLAPDPAATGADVGKAYIVDDPKGTPGYVCAIGNAADPTRPRFLNGMGTIQRYLYGWTVATGPVWHYVYADNTGIYEWRPAAGEPLQLPLDSNGHLDATSLYSQFWREHYERFLYDPANPDWLPGGDPRQFQPGAVSVDPAGGWIVINRVFDRRLSQALRQRGRLDEMRRIQVFKIASTPWPAGDYNPGTANFGYGASSIRWLFGPQLLDLRYRDLKVDLAQPMYAVRSR